MSAPSWGARAAVVAGLVIIAAVNARCAHGFDLRPDEINVELEHISHATQHWPFATGSECSDFGYEDISLVARWRFGSRWRLDIAEGASLDDTGVNKNDLRWTGALMGPREVFHARLDYVLWRRE